MKPLLLLFALLPLLLSQKNIPPNDGKWVPAFVDEFNGTELDLTRWSTHDPWGRVRDRQLQAYVPEAVVVSGGQLHIVAKRTPVNPVPIRYDGKDREYVSGIISTFGTFAQTYGRFENPLPDSSRAGTQAGIPAASGRSW
jgi:beta-glucanase (GH16 family)